MLCLHGRVAPTEATQMTKWLVKPKIFTVWLFTEKKSADPWPRQR